MKKFLQAESFYIKKDSGFRSVAFMLLLASIILVLWIYGAGDWQHVENLLEPLGTIMILSIFLYFIIPLYTCFFSTEGFENGTVKNIIASGTSRSTYFWGKFISMIKVLIWLILQFYIVYFILFTVVTIVLGGNIGDNGVAKDAVFIFSATAYNILYLTAYISVVFMIGFIVRKTSITTIMTFAFVFGNLLIYGYWKDSTIELLRTISRYSLMTQIVAFSRGLLPGATNNIIAVVIPLVIIGISLSTTIIVFNKRDIQSY